MTVHTCLPGHPGVLADGCDRCAEHAAAPMLLDLDVENTEALWAKMLAVERDYSGGYATVAEAKAGRTFYLLAVWLERFTNVDPWRPLDQWSRQRGRPLVGTDDLVEAVNEGAAEMAAAEDSERGPVGAMFAAAGVDEDAIAMFAVNHAHHVARDKTFAVHAEAVSALSTMFISAFELGLRVGRKHG